MSDSHPTMRKPEYDLVESLIREVLDDMRNVHLLMATGETGSLLAKGLRAAANSHERLAAALDRDALNAHAAGHLFATVLHERLESLRSLARAGQEILPAAPPDGSDATRART